MTTSEERSRVTEIQELIIALAVEQDEAQRRRDPQRAAELRSEIARLTTECDRLRDEH